MTDPDVKVTRLEVTQYPPTIRQGKSEKVHNDLIVNREQIITQCRKKVIVRIIDALSSSWSEQREPLYRHCVGNFSVDKS